MIEIKSDYIHNDQILSRIYADAVKKFMAIGDEQICFIQICQYVEGKLIQKKQSVYDHSIMIVKEVCQKIGEDFFNAVKYYSPMAKNYRDIYYSIYE